MNVTHEEYPKTMAEGGGLHNIVVSGMGMNAKSLRLDGVTGLMTDSQNLGEAKEIEKRVSELP